MYLHSGVAQRSAHATRAVAIPTDADKLKSFVGKVADADTNAVQSSEAPDDAESARFKSAVVGRTRPFA